MQFTLYRACEWYVNTGANGTPPDAVAYKDLLVNLAAAAKEILAKEAEKTAQTAKVATANTETHRIKAVSDTLKATQAADRSKVKELLDSLLPAPGAQPPPEAAVPPAPGAPGAPGAR